MSKHKRMGVIVLAIAGIFALGFGVWSIGYKIKSPFFLEKVDISSLLAETNDFSDKDTDLDGLTDFDETNFYKTSPYLEDSDSDGISDLKEVKDGTDPNCPKDKDCGTSYLDTTTSDLVFPDPLGFDTSSDIIAPQENPLVNPDGTIRKDLSANDIREILRVMGMDSDELDKLNDNDLIKLYKESLSDIQL